MNINKNEITSIHYMRGIAASLIVIYHILNRKNNYNPLNINWLNSGVDLFFVISGFVIFSVAINPNTSPKEFLRRRFIRVIPLYWFFTTIFILLKLSIPNFDSSSSFHIAQAIKSFLFIPHYHSTYPKEIWPILIPGWSLNYEIFFYLTFAGILFTGRNFLFTKMAILFSMLIAVKLFFENKNPIYLTYTNPIILEFLAGIFLANLYYNTQFFKNRKKLLFLGFPIVIIGFIFFVLSREPSISQMPRALKWGLPATLIIFGCLLSEKLISKFKVSFLRVLGNASYSIYLSHSFGIGACSFLWKKTNYSFQGISLFIFSIVTLTICILVGMMSYYLIEKPLLNFLQKKSKRIDKEITSHLPEKQMMIK
jgi:exopolysaccharide production protein ExoZ